MVIAREGFHEADEFVTDCSVYYEIIPRQGEAILWAGLVDFCEIDAKPPLAILFFD